MRLGIFAKRDIIEGEELTFNYNVDRYGLVSQQNISERELIFFKRNRYDAQACYCGEPNCSGFIGGNTQTDLSAMDDLYLDGQFPFEHETKVDTNSLAYILALGVSEEIAALGLKGNKRKKARKLDEDFKVSIVDKSLITYRLSNPYYSQFSNPCNRSMSLK
jgi:hypothetical protein